MKKELTKELLINLFNNCLLLKKYDNTYCIHKNSGRVDVGNSDWIILKHKNFLLKLEQKEDNNRPYILYYYIYLEYIKHKEETTEKYFAISADESKDLYHNFYKIENAKQKIANKNYKKELTLLLKELI